jgi:G:T-mismatch repair DNA endonuclease (very short patch repair protein)
MNTAQGVVFMQSEEKKSKSRERERVKRENLNFYIETNCSRCENKVMVKAYAENYYKRRGGGTCKECLKKQSSDLLKKLRATQTPEEKSEHAKAARASSSPEARSNAIKKQWEQFRANPAKFAEVCQAKSSRMKKIWSETYTETEKNKIISALVSGNNCGRSKISEQFKQTLIENQLYDGFESEKVFHGFVPDEINDELKIIIEVFGDLYHCNPRKYKDPALFINATQRTVQEQWDRDRIKLACYYKHGYTTIIVWESDIRKKLSEQIERVKNEIAKKRVAE